MVPGYKVRFLLLSAVTLADPCCRRSSATSRLCNQYASSSARLPFVYSSIVDTRTQESRVLYSTYSRLIMSVIPNGANHSYKPTVANIHARSSAFDLGTYLHVAMAGVINFLSISATTVQMHTSCTLLTLLCLYIGYF